MRVDVRKLTILGVLVIGVGVLLPASPAAGVISTTGDIVPAYDGSSDPWVIPELKIGDTGAANMTLSGTSRVGVMNAAYMAYHSGSTANVLLSDSGSLWECLARLYIGGTDTQAGGTAVLTIAAGRVETSQAVIWSTGTLTGNGTLKAPSVTNWGTIRPGGSIGTLTIDGNITFQPSSVLEVEVNNSGASDKLAVTGDVGIVGGTVKAISTNTIVGAKEYTIITAHNVTGKFTTLDTALLHVAMIDPNERLGYTADKVLLRITADPFDLAIGQTPNQLALGTALQKIAVAGGTAITGALQQLPNLDAVRAAYDQLSGQSRPPLAQIAVTDTAKFMGIVANRLQSSRGSVARDLQSLSDSPLLAAAGRDSGIATGPTAGSWDSFLWDLGRDSSQLENQNWGTWGKVYGVFGDRKTTNGVTGYSYNFLGETGGVDLQLSDRFIGGAMGGHSSGQVDYDTVTDKADITTTYTGLYSTYWGDGWYLNSMVTYAWLNLHTERTVDLVPEQHEGYFDGREQSAYIEAGFDWQPARTWLVQPLAAFQATRLHLDQYAETGLPSALVFEDQRFESYTASVGAKVTKELSLGVLGRAAIVQGRGRWVHEFGDVESSVETRFEDVPPISWTVTDEAVSRDSILLGVGAGIRLTKGLRAFVDFDTSFNADRTVQVISGALDYRW